MKLRTKFQDEDFEVGEVVDVDITTMPDGRIKARSRAGCGGLRTFFYNTKAGFDADWEDVPEETKTYFYISTDGYISESSGSDFILAINRKEFGNHFETEEQAKLALDKIKAWQEIKKDLDGELHWQTEGGGRFSIWGHFISSGLLRDEAILDNHREDLDILLKNREGGEE